MSHPSTGAGLRAGDSFGGYEVVRRIGAGAFGAVYEAVRLPLRKRVALKVLHREHTREPDMLDRFLREAEIVAQVEHPNIVSVFDVGVHDEQPYIAMELLDGESLAARLERDGALDPGAAVDLMLAVTSAAATVHARGIVHRDLKPDNVLLARQATGAVLPKLLDFGIAKVRDGGRALTATNAIMGTPQYMSPEQARESKHVGPESDQWALGVILFECLTGRCPFARANLLAVLVAITTEATPRLRDHRPELPAALEAALLRAMDPAPERRWSSARAFGEALLPFATDTGRAQWTGFFAAPATDPAELGRQSTLPPTVAPAAVARQETLAPATRSSLDPARRTTRLRAGAAGLVALVAALAAGAALARRPGAPAPSPAPVALRRPPPAAAPPPVTAIASPDAGAPVAAAPAPAPVVAPVIAPAALVAGEPAARRHHRHRRAPGAEAFPNF